MTSAPRKVNRRDCVVAAVACIKVVGCSDSERRVVDAAYRCMNGDVTPDDVWGAFFDDGDLHGSSIAFALVRLVCDADVARAWYYFTHRLQQEGL